MKITAQHFKKFEDTTKNKVINMVCRFATHNFISKDALVEIVKYQNKKIKELEKEENDIPV